MAQIFQSEDAHLFSLCLADLASERLAPVHDALYSNPESADVRSAFKQRTWTESMQDAERWTYAAEARNEKLVNLYKATAAYYMRAVLRRPGRSVHKLRYFLEEFMRTVVRSLHVRDGRRYARLGYADLVALAQSCTRQTLRKLLGEPARPSELTRAAPKEPAKPLTAAGGRQRAQPGGRYSGFRVAAEPPNARDRLAAAVNAATSSAPARSAPFAGASAVSNLGPDDSLSVAPAHELLPRRRSHRPQQWQPSAAVASKTKHSSFVPDGSEESESLGENDTFTGYAKVETLRSLREPNDETKVVSVGNSRRR